MAGFGGDRWGAAGGGEIPVQAPETVKQALSTGQRQTNYELDRQPPPTRDVLSEMSNARLRGDAPNGAFVEGYSTAGNPIAVRGSIQPPVGPNCTILGSMAIPLYAIPGCMIPGVGFTVQDSRNGNGQFG